MSLQRKGVTLLGQSSAALTNTGNTTENVLATITVPANAMGANGAIEILSLWSMPSNANTKTLRIRWGGSSGTIIYSSGGTTILTAQGLTRIANRNATNSQVAAPATLQFATGAAAVVTASVDTTAAVDIVLTAQCAVGTDTITLESYSVKLVR